MAVMGEIGMFIVSYLGVIFISLFIVNWLQGRFLLPFLRVKMSRGRLVLVNIKGKIQNYFHAGNIEDSFLVYRHKKETIRLELPDDAIYRGFGVNVVDVDDIKHAIVKKDFGVVSGYDPVKFDNLLQRALMRPGMQDNFQKIMLVLIIVAIVGILFLAYKVMSVESLLQGLQTIEGSV